MKPKWIGAVFLAMLAILLAPAGDAQENTAGDSEDKWYQVEVLVFERRGDWVLQAESWDTDPGHPPIESSIALIAPGESPVEGPGPHAFHILPENELNLVKIRGHLERGAETTPILHVGWRQPGVSKDNAQWVNLYLPPREGNSAPASAKLLGMAQRVGAGGTETAGQPALVPLDALQAPMIFPPMLDGTIRVHLSRYLHADVDLIYHRENAETPFRLNATRRMRSGELHYLDHPVYGVLIKVVPVEVDKSN